MVSASRAAWAIASAKTVRLGIHFRLARPPEGSKKDLPHAPKPPAKQKIATNLECVVGNCSIRHTAGLQSRADGNGPADVVPLKLTTTESEHHGAYLMRALLLSGVSSLAFLVSIAQAADDPAATWKAGVAKAVITPEQPLWLAGYGGRDHPAESTLHDVWIKALALEAADGGRVVLLTSDLCGIPRWMYDSVSEAIDGRHGLDRSRVRLTYSHNHCAPVVRGDLEDYYPLDETQQRLVAEYSTWLEGQMIATIGQALENLRPATVSAGRGTCTFAVNRRNNREAEVPDILASGGQLNGPIDHTVPVLAVHAADGEKDLLAVVFAYACHNTTLSFYQVCGDYAGFAQIAIEEQHPGATALFVTGCGGDQNPLPRRTVELCEKYGRQLAAGVEEVLAAPGRPLQPRLRTAFESVDLSFQRNPTRAELEQYEQGTNAIRQRWARRFLKQLDAGQPLAQSAPLAIQAWRLGDQDWISLGGETLVDYAHRFRAEHGDETWVTSYSADLLAYIPSRRNIIEGLYEGTNLYEYMQPADAWALDTEERIAASVGRLMQQIQGE
jgi:neutral ceramidase